MASGIPLPQWNNADVTGPDPDLEQLSAWYGQLGMPWGVRVPTDLDHLVDVGEPLFVKRGFGATSRILVPPDRAARDDGLTVRRARWEELDRFVHAEVAMFATPRSLARRFVEPVFGRDGFEHWLALRGEDTLAIATLVLTDGEAGPAAMLTGLAARPGDEPAKAVLASAALTSTLERRPDALLHVHADPDDDVDELLALGFVEVEGFIVRLVVDAAVDETAG